MRKRSFYRVCRCTPTEGITHIETRWLCRMIDAQVHALRCAESCRWKYQRGLLLGDLCASSGHPWWAIKVWRFTQSLIFQKDYNDWIWEHVNPAWVRLTYVLCEEETAMLGRRIDDTWRHLGHPELAVMEAYARSDYDWFWMEKFDYDPSEYLRFEADIAAYEADKATNELFEQALPAF